MTNPADQPTWRVDSQSPTTRVSPTGQVEDGYDIAFTTGLGQPGTVFVANARYTPANVKAVIAARAAQIDAIATLAHDSEV